MKFGYGDLIPVRPKRDRNAPPHRRGEALARVLRIAERLRVGHPVTFDWIAREFGVNYRTARRDMQVIEAAGLPVYDELETGQGRGHGRKEWRLVR